MSQQLTLAEFEQRMKRRRTEMEKEEAALDDSLKEEVTHWKKIEDPSNKNVIDCVSTLVSKFLTRQELLSTQMKEVHENVEVIRDEVVELDLKVDSLKINDQLREREIHKLQQSNLDNDIIMLGFPNEPKPAAFKTLMVNYGVYQTDIKHQYTFKQQFTVKPKQSNTSEKGAKPKNQVVTFYNVVITFDKYAKKTEFLKKRNSLGPLKYSTLANFDLYDKDKIKEEDDDKTVKISNRMSKFNLDAQKMINKTKATHQWDSIKFHGGLFHLTKGNNRKILATYDDVRALEPEKMETGK